MQRLDDALRRLAETIGGDPDRPGSGAAGGTAFGLVQLWGAESVPGAPAVAALVRLDERCATADAVVTGEGRYDRTSRSGKLVGTVVDTGRRHGARVALVAGAIEPDVDPGCDATCSLTDLAGSGAAALAEPVHWLERAGARLAEEWPWALTGRQAQPSRSGSVRGPRTWPLDQRTAAGSASENSGKPLEPDLERDPQLHPGQVRPDAAVDAEPERGVPVDLAVDDDLVGPLELLRVAVGGRERQQHPVVGLHVARRASSCPP